jgi:hypothetical protein
MGRINSWYFAINVANHYPLGGGLGVFTPRIYRYTRRNRVLPRRAQHLFPGAGRARLHWPASVSCCCSVWLAHRHARDPILQGQAGAGMGRTLSQDVPGQHYRLSGGRRLPVAGILRPDLLHHDHPGLLEKVLILYPQRTIRRRCACRSALVQASHGQAPGNGVTTPARPSGIQTSTSSAAGWPRKAAGLALGRRRPTGTPRSGRRSRHAPVPCGRPARRAACTGDR